MSIRLKVILPYFLLTIVVATIGLYVITNLIATRQEERLKNQLLDAGRVVSREFSRQEKNRLTQARQIAYTEGLIQALRAGDRLALERVVRPVAESARLEEVFVIDLQGREQLHLLRNAEGALESIEGEIGMGKAAWLAPLLLATGEVSDRIWGKNPLDGRYYHYSAVTVVEGRQAAGVVVIGTALETLLPDLKNFAIADVVLYDGEGRLIASTLSVYGADLPAQDAFALNPRTLREIHESPDLVFGENFTLAGRKYSIARDVLQVGQRNLGVFGVILPLDFVISIAQDSRNNYLFLFGIIALGVVGMGYLVSRPLIVSLQKLLQASLAVAGGDLDQRTNIRTDDEIGELARTFDEMTARLQARTEELQKTYAVLEQMDRAKASFIEVAAHELRTPLTLVKGYTQMLAMKLKEEPEVSALAHGILEGAERMQEIVSSMLDVSRIDSNILKILPEDVNLGVVIGRAHTTFEQALQERNLTLTVQGVDSLPLIQADPDQLYKVFYHLLMNAIKYTPDGGRITIYGHLRENPQGEEEVEIVFSDTGIGIDPQHHSLIFEKFYQTGEVYMHSSGKTKFKGGGPGLGLAIARGIVQAHGGRIWVESPGHDEARCPGSQFFVRLPLKAKSHERDSLSAP